ncbi:uncharacterized protein C05D11.1-like isoform X2 [Pectinophora gossypiella]|uniref:uncharacterized protein C05D11.1-like isoform X2 n=1 Tax=Pectinophora gossypiella TaxID=13191 RepID=UPI00214F513B|nr:uncharacterized protein C05D11.1-like isoform X2 [Pectinophora gossypiella]
MACQKSDFRLVSSTKASDVIPVNKYVSCKTGITVIIADVEGPLVNGFFCLATEAHDDDGLPHTLEHLIFLGSERYPYKGILDLLANRCMAHGTNAWTDTDHTCYTIYTAGDEGMLTLLPIYLDHILMPTLTDEGFITEVHHVDGDGENAGVVYCEMQGRENNADSRCELRLLRAMYPNSGYSSETGGIMKNLRESTTNTKVRNFHKKFYRPENLTIILTGQISADDVFSALGTVEDDIIAKRGKKPQDEWQKPWTTVPPTPLYGELKEQWPADTEDCGQVLFGWRGPILKESHALKDLTACAVLLRYLCDTASAPLQRCLVEREDAFAGDVSYNLTENIAPLIKIELDNVPIDKLEAARDQARACIDTVRSGAEPLDMERLRRLLKKQLRESIASLESDPHHAIAFRCIGDALYSQNEHDFISRMNPQQDLEELLGEGPEYWLRLMQKYLTDDVVTIVGSPSIDMQTKMAEEEKKRIEEQRAQLGEEGLARKAKELADAMEFNERPPPPGTLASVPVPSCSNLRCHNISSWSSDGAPCPHMDLKQIPLYARVHSLKTNFVYINLILDTTSIDENTRKWLPLHMNGLAECPVMRNGQLIPHEEVISTTEQLVVLFSNDVGFGRSGNFSVGIFGNFLHIETRCEPKDYEQVVNHLYEVLFAAEITKERLLVFTQRMINDVSQVRRNGHKLVYDILRDSLYSKDSNVHWNSVLRQQKFLKDLNEQLNAGGDAADAALREARATLSTITRDLWIHLATDFDRYKLSTEPWKRFARENEITPPVPRLYWDAELMSGYGGGFVVGVGGVESSYLVQLAPGPRGYSADEAAPLLVALNYFTQLEGPMWRLIRGCGLSYGYGVRPAPNEGRIVFSLYKATNCVAAYTKAKSIVAEYFKEGNFDEDLFESSKSTALFEVVENEKCPADVVSQSLLNYLKRVSDTYSRDLVRAIASVTPEAAKSAAQRWLPTLFDPTQSKTSIVCHPSKVNDMQAAFEKINVKLEAFESMEASHFNK